MDKSYAVTRLLVKHFFRRFFDNDTLQAEGDTQTTVVRALSIVAVPGLMTAFWLQNQYRWAPLWGAIEAEYVFVLISFVVMGAVAIFEWEMLFPDRLDFLVLSPLPLRPWEMLAAKADALLGFLALFLVSCNLFGTLILPMVSKDGFFHQMMAQGVAVLLAGVFAASVLLALGGVLLCVLGGARFRTVSPMMQMLAVMGLVLLVLQFLEYGNAMRVLLAEPLGMARWMPSLWFLGVYESLLRGEDAPAFAREMTRCALWGAGISVAAAVLTYPLAWARMHKMAMEGDSRSRRRPARWPVRLADVVVRRPGERAVFHFIGQTLRRSNRYQVYLAIYGGTGLGLAVASMVAFRVQGMRFHPALSDKGLHAVMPLVLFWVIAGLRTAFAFPLNLTARWVFRVTGVAIGKCAAGARRWVFLCAVGVMCAVLAALRVAGWGAIALLVQLVCGLCLSLLLTDALFFSQNKVPFNQPRMPGKTSLPLMLTLYVGVFPPLVLWAIDLGRHLEKKPWQLVPMVIATAIVHSLMRARRRGYEEVEEEMEGYEGEFQLLGIS
jgi:hypothetical protein